MLNMFGGRPDDFASQLGNDAGGLAPGHSAPGDGGLASLLSSFLRLFVDRATKKQQVYCYFSNPPFLLFLKLIETDCSGSSLDSTERTFQK